MAGEKEMMGLVPRCRRCLCFGLRLPRGVGCGGGAWLARVGVCLVRPRCRVLSLCCRSPSPLFLFFWVSPEMAFFSVSPEMAFFGIPGKGIFRNLCMVGQSLFLSPFSESCMWCVLYWRPLAVCLPQTVPILRGILPILRGIVVNVQRRCVNFKRSYWLVVPLFQKVVRGRRILCELFRRTASIPTKQNS